MIRQPEVHAGKVTHVASSREPRQSRGRRPLAAVLAAGVLVAGACSDDGEDRGLEALDTPQFAPDERAGTVQSPTSQPDTSTTIAAAVADPGAPTSTGTDDGAAPTTPSDAPQERVTIDDPDDDAIGGLDDDPPAWSDLAAVTLIRQGNAYGLQVTLAGGDAPDSAEGGSTMNIASFYDTDGDGGVDYEIWANLGPEGWGGAWFDDQDNAAFAEDSNVTIEVHGDRVLILFPDVMLDAPDRFQFSVASEYGELDALGSAFTRRDDVPDDDRAISFPG